MPNLVGHFRGAKVAYLFLILLFAAGLASSQSNTGDLRLKVTDPSGSPVRTSLTVTSEANSFHTTYSTDDSGAITVKRLPYGLYTVEILGDGFAPFAETVEIRTATPTEFTAKLSIASSSTSVEVKDSATLIDPYRTGSINRIGTQQIEDRESSLPGRSLQDLVNSQPGWIYEGNAVLHPRGSEYQTQIVVDGIPLQDNRSPSFGPEIEADDIQSLSIFTADFPAEYGRKMGGVVEANTTRDLGAGFHGKVVLSGGSFDTAGGFASGQYQWGKNVLGASASGDMTSHYLNPVVPQNFTNKGTTGDFSVRYERDLTVATASASASATKSHATKFLTSSSSRKPVSFRTATILKRWASSPTNASFARRHRQLQRHGPRQRQQPILQSSLHSGHRIPAQLFPRGYFKGTVAIHKKRHEIKVGVESDNTFLHEKFNDFITDPDDFDPDTPQTYAFTGNKPDLEQSAFVQDEIRLGKWTVSAGLRWDHYQLLVNQNAVSPRLGVGYYIPKFDIVFHATNDRIFQRRPTKIS